MRTTINKWGNSQGIRLPKHLLKRANMQLNGVVDVEIEGDHILIKNCQKTRKYRTLEEIFKDYDGDCTTTEINWGKPQGEEVW